MASSKKTKSLSCVSCGLRDGDVLSPKMPPYGDGKQGILVIGEAPGKVEDQRGKPWQGRTGRLLQKTLGKLGVDLFEDCVSVNAVNCRPPNNRTPSSFEIDCCREVVVRKAINEFKPKVIILLGTVAVHSFLGDRWHKDLGGISKWRGFLISDQDFQCWVLPTFHPSYVSRMDSREVNTVWEQDLELAVSATAMDFPKEPEDGPKIHYIEDLSVLYSLKHVEELSFDYETTGLKPQREDQRIVCASVAVNEHEVYTFMMPETKFERRPFTTLLKNPDIGKMAHNFKFEHKWTKERYWFDVENWLWDSMIAAHILDNRSGITGLKFQTYVNFGVIYGDDVLPYFRKDEESGNGTNKIYDLLEEPGGKEKLMKYCALDSHYEFRLAKLQMELLDIDESEEEEGEEVDELPF
jgi:uracil-DNA glycosylase family 4